MTPLPILAKTAAARARSIAAAPAALAILLLGRCAFLVSSLPLERAPRLANAYVDLGETLLHALPSGDFFRMPLAGIFFALAAHARIAPHHVGMILAASQVLLLASLTRLLLPGSRLAPLVSAWALLEARELGGVHDAYAAYSVLVLLTANVLVWRAAAPSPKRSLLLALCVGASLLFRSPLAFFGPALVAWERLAFGRRDRRTGWKDFFILGLLPYALLVPWIGMNWEVNRRFVPFEDGAASSNVVAGALGLVETVEGDWSKLIDGASPATGGDVLIWAAREIARHPARYVRACALRLLFAARLHPALFALALLAAFLWRKDRACASLVFLASYVLGAHCLMSVSSNYFHALWPLLIALGACFTRSIEPGSRNESGLSSDRAAERFVLVFAAAVLLLGLYAEWVVVAYARAARVPAALERARREYPEDAWLAMRSSERHLGRGDFRAAAADAARARDLEPNEETDLLFAWASLHNGDPRPLQEWRFVPGGPSRRGRLNLRGRAYQAYAAWSRGRARPMREHVAGAWGAYQEEILVRDPLGPREREMLGRMRSSCAEFADDVVGLFRFMGASRRASLRGDIIAAVPDSSSCRVEQAVAALESGRPKDAAAFLRSAKKLGPTSEEMKRMLRVYERLGDRREALALADALTRRFPADGGLWLERAALALRLGRRGEAAAAIARALERKPEAERALAAATLCRQLGADRAAGPLLDFAAESLSETADYWIERAAASVRSGSRRDAFRALARARALRPDARQALLIAHLRLQLAPRRDLAPKTLQ